MHLPPRSAAHIASGLLTLAVAAQPASAHSAPAAPPPLLRQAVADLPVTAETREGYKRTSFKHWTDSDGDGCSARFICTPDRAAA